MRYVIAVWAALAFAAPALAQDYPTKTIHVIVPNSATEWDSIVMRWIANAMSITLGQSVIVENYPGAKGRLGIERCLSAQPDGYTLCGTTYGHMNVLAADSIAAGDEPPYDPSKQLVPIGQIAEGKYLFVVNKKIPVRTLSELVAYAKVNPPLAYAAHGPSSVLVGKILQASLGITFTELDYGGGPGEGKAMSDFIAGFAELNVGAVLSIKPYLSSLNVLGVFGGNGRSAFFPDVPSLSEQGVAGMDLVRSWSSLWAPLGTPLPVVQTVSKALKAALSDPEMRRKLNAMALEPGSADPDELKSLLVDMPKLASFMRQNGIRIFGK